MNYGCSHEAVKEITEIVTGLACCLAGKGSVCRRHGWFI